MLSAVKGEAQGHFCEPSAEQFCGAVLPALTWCFTARIWSSCWWPWRSAWRAAGGTASRGQTAAEGLILVTVMILLTWLGLASLLL